MDIWNDRGASHCTAALEQGSSAKQDKLNVTHCKIVCAPRIGFGRVDFRAVIIQTLWMWMAVGIRAAGGIGKVASIL